MSRVKDGVRIRRVLVPAICLATVSMLAACGDDSGSSSSSSPGGTGSVTTEGGAGGGSAAVTSGSSNGTSPVTTGGAPTTEGTTTTSNPVVPDAQATSGLVQTAVEMKFLAASVKKGQATDESFQGVFTAWDVYDGTIQKRNPTAWQQMTDALTAMHAAVTNKDAAAADAAASAFEAASNGYLSG